MDLAERLNETVIRMKEHKEAWVATKPDNPDLAIYQQYYRGDELAITVQCAVDRDKALVAARIGATGFNADTLAVTFESYHTELHLSPITGKPWMHLEMQYVSETYPEAHEKGWVTPCLTTSIHERGGAYALTSVPYLLAEGSVTWLPEQQLDSSEEDHSGSGVMFASLQESMARPKILDMVRQEDPVSKTMLQLVADEEEQLFHSDVATATALMEKDIAIAIMFAADPGTDREKWLTERFGEPGFHE